MDTIITNIKNNVLQDEFSTECLNGNIKIASNRGYPNIPERKQEDAVGSAIRNENCYLNIVADGVGNTGKGAIASKKIVDDITKWFIALDEIMLQDKDIIIELLQKKIDQINDELNKEYDGKALTTFVLALTIHDITIIASLGDSMAYELDEEGYVNRLNHIDSWSDDYMCYDDIRYSGYNFITAGVGDYFKDEIHTSIIDNMGQKIILSTDGVTDLISEEKFTSYFLKDVKAEDIVNDAIYNPEVEYLEKKEDNVSAIIINLPTHTKERKYPKVIIKSLNGLRAEEVYESWKAFNEKQKN